MLDGYGVCRQREAGTQHPAERCARAYRPRQSSPLPIIDILVLALASCPALAQPPRPAFVPRTSRYEQSSLTKLELGLFGRRIRSSSSFSAKRLLHEDLEHHRAVEGLW